MSLTKENFESEFNEQTVGSVAEQIRCEQFAHQDKSKIIDDKKLKNLLESTREIPRIDLTVKKFSKSNNKYLPELATIKGKFRGVLFTDDAPVIKRIEVLIEVHGFQVKKLFRLEEADENFTHLEFTIKNI